MNSPMPLSTDSPAAAPNSAAAASPSGRRRDWASIFLTATALLVGGLLATHLSKLVGGTPAAAEMVATSGDFTLLTVDAGNNEDVAVILDQRGESLVLYRCVNQRAVDFLGRNDLREMFIAAKRGGK